MADQLARKKNRDQDARLDALTTKLDELATRADALEANASMVGESLSDHDARLDAGVASFGRLTDEIALARGELTSLRSDLARQSGRIDTALGSIAGLTARVEALEGVPPDPPPDATWTLLRSLDSASDWKAKLIEGFTGASITDTAEGIRFWIPSAQSVGSGRCELQEAPLGVEGDELAYEWSFRIPKATVLSTTADKENLIQQGHGNQRAGFTQGTSIDQATEQIKVKVKGGRETSTAGSHRYAYENEFVFGQVKRDTWHIVRIEVLWHRSKGYMRARLDGGLWSGVGDAPTWPLGDADGVPTENIMFRLGWYPSAGRSYGPMEMLVSGLRVYGRAA